MSTKTALSWDEFLAAGEEWQRWERVDGEVEFMSPANARHGVVIRRLLARLDDYCNRHPEWIGFASDTAFTMKSDNWRCPDAALVRAERFPGRAVPAEPAGFPPEVAFEVFSPGDTAAQIQRKRKDYQESGVIQVWIDAEKRLAELIYPDRALQYFSENQPLIIDKLPDFALDLKQLFSI